jgi:hypothetical protein
MTPLLNSSVFQCPQQSSLKLHRSRVNDGICDCCDGADEKNAGNCRDVCAVILEAERSKKAKAEKDFGVGYQKRQKELVNFSKLVDETLAKVEVAEKVLHSLNVDGIEAQISMEKHVYLKERLTTAALIAGSSTMQELLEPLSTDEIIAFIVHSCQLSGEMEDASEETTCVALRLAGLDMGLTLGGENFDNPENISVERGQDQSTELAEVLYKNAMNDHGEKAWSVSEVSSKNRRRLQEDEDVDEDEYGDSGMYDDDYMGMPDSEENDHHHDNDDDNDDEVDYRRERDYRHNRHRNKDDDDDDVAPVGGKQKETMDEIQALVFSKTRVSFTARSKQVSGDIDKLLDTNKDDKDAESEEEDTTSEEEQTAETEQKAPPVDPAAFTMVRSTLRRKEERIARGFKYAASAKVLLKALESGETTPEKIREEAAFLALGTLNHGKLKAEHVWQILQAILPEFSEPLAAASDEQTCSSPWAGACPPETKERKTSSGKKVQYPPAFILSAADALCTEQVNEALEGACAADSGSDIPTSIPEGYYGYISVTARGDDDFLTKAFAPLDSLQVDRSKMEALEKQRDDLNKRKKELKTDLDKMLDNIGGRSADNLGPDGELHALKDTCHAVIAGKYIYEVCLNGEARQKDRDKPKDNGTLLGRWKRMEIDAKTGERVLRWENGARCWNGPARSAHVHVTCGPENKVLSAEEPDTCRYVLQMESHIACDDKFKEKFGL